MASFLETLARKFSLFSSDIGIEDVYKRQIQGAMQAGILAGYPVVDVKVTLYDGSYHEVDSSEMAFKIAGSMAFKEAMKKACLLYTSPSASRAPS